MLTSHLLLSAKYRKSNILYNVKIIINIFMLYFRLKKIFKIQFIKYKREYNNNTQSFNLNGCRV